MVNTSLGHLNSKKTSIQRKQKRPDISNFFLFTYMETVDLRIYVTDATVTRSNLLPESQPYRAIRKQGDVPL